MKKDKTRIEDQRERLASMNFSEFDDRSPVETFTSNDLITQRKIKAPPKKRFNFLIDEQLIDDFMTYCAMKKTVASKLLVDFVEKTVSENRERIEQFKEFQD